MPGQQGRTALVTGANSGIGFQVALELARHGAEVLLACRDTGRGTRARDEIVRQVPGAEVELVALVNHLGHFALTGRLLPVLLGRPDSRVVTVSSIVHRFGSIRLDDLNGEHGYGRWRAYSQSKLANALFTLELDRRLRAAGAGTMRAATDPAARGGDYYGPRGPAEMAGAPRRVRYTRSARDEPLAGRLWQASETLTGVAFPV
jgi:NAD(P)-dependent dehydrogenase (short-subunit alcohol dehydrogenase family)